MVAWGELAILPTSLPSPSGQFSMLQALLDACMAE